MMIYDIDQPAQTDREKSEKGNIGEGTSNAFQSELPRVSESTISIKGSDPL